MGGGGLRTLSGWGHLKTSSGGRGSTFLSASPLPPLLENSAVGRRRWFFCKPCRFQQKLAMVQTNSGVKFHNIHFNDPPIDAFDGDICHYGVFWIFLKSYWWGVTLNKKKGSVMCLYFLCKNIVSRILDIFIKMNFFF